MKNNCLINDLKCLHDLRVVWTPEIQKQAVIAILVSWFIALFEYVFQVPANRIGAQMFSVTQLKIMQECITLVVFTVIAYLVFGQSLKWNNPVSYVLIVGAVYFSFAF
jgi:uncharacterized protein